MVVWIKQYKRGVAWYCDIANKRLSPIMRWDEALIANMVGARISSSRSNPYDARCVRDWKETRERAKFMMRNESDHELKNKLREFYGTTDFKPWE
jgi:hypothetical protein